MTHCELVSPRDAPIERDALVWRLAQPHLVASSTVVGGGVGVRQWLVNAEVGLDYARHDIDVHAREIAAALALNGDGVVMLTAAHVARHQLASDEGVDVDATVGLSVPTWAASSEPTPDGVLAPGTINLIVSLPVRLDAGALVNAVVTATEAKCQALGDMGVPATGTASDAVAVFCPLAGDPVLFAGPRSLWGARIARATFEAVRAGATAWLS